MKRSQIVLLSVAIVAGGLAGFLVLRGGGRPAPAPQQQAAKVVEATKDKVLVAARDVGVGQRLTEADMQWQDWPQSGLRSEYVTQSAMPNAETDMTGAVARFEIFAGEPIQDAKLAHTDQGYLSAVLSPGMRGVSVSVTPESGSGGFIIPNDHVDVVSTHDSSGGGQVSETILANVKVLAIGTRLGEVGQGKDNNGNPDDPDAKTFSGTVVATLELDPGQAETLLSGASDSKLSLVLRSVADFAQTTADNSAGNQAVRVIRYGKQVSVMAARDPNAAPDPSAAPATVNPAAYPAPAPNPDAAAAPVVNLQ
ncbi:MAG TPA: Flp pilus assembly protein CpaB [Devosiaceae bacterium]|jgi:pilus assembly protein CpaB